MRLTLSPKEVGLAFVKQTTYVGADSPLDWHFILESWALMCVCHFVDLKVVDNELDCVLHTVPKSGVPRSIDVFVVVHEQSLRTVHAVIPAHIVRPPVLSSEGPLHALALRDVELVRSQSIPHLLQVPLPISLLPLCEVFHGIESVRLGLTFALRISLKDIVTDDFAIATVLNIADFVPHGIDPVNTLHLLLL